MRNELNSLKIYELGFSLRLSHTHVACNNMHGQRGRNRKLKVGQQISGGETIKVHSRSRLDQRSFLSSPKPFFKLPRKLSNRAQWLGYFVHSRSCPYREFRPRPVSNERSGNFTFIWVFTNSLIPFLNAMI